MADGADGTDRSSSHAHSSGLLRGLRELADTSIAALQTRLELLSADGQAAGWRLAAIVVYGVCALFCLFVAIVLLNIAIIVAYWDRDPVLAVGLSGAFFLSVGVVCAVVAFGYMRARPGLFAATLATLASDREALRGRRGPRFDDRPGTGDPVAPG
ncbi:MAG: phage holin family protein, partial [Proteobacteria bacterium]|nr:phage holin family protein [Burkholderiales bacterium]